MKMIIIIIIIISLGLLDESKNMLQKALHIYEINNGDAGSTIRKKIDEYMLKV